MSAQSIPAVVIASITFYVGLYHLLIYLRRKRHREDLTFALMCLATGCYAVFCSGLYNAVSVVEGAQWQRLQFIALAVLTTAFLWFAADYTGQKPGIATYAFTAYYLLAVIVQCVDRSSLTWLVDQPAIKTITLPLLNHPIVYYEATLGPFTAVQGLIGLAASTYILWISLYIYRQGHRRKTVPLLLALGCMYAAAFNDTLVSQGAYRFIYVIEYSYLAMVLLMAYSLSSTAVEAAMAKEALRESEARWQFANEALAKMQVLLAELLELSRVGRVMNPPEVVSFEAIACQAIEAAQGRIEAGGVQVEIAPGLPEVYGDRARLVEAVQNLLDNACKFTGEQSQPRIEIGMRETETGPVFYVRDNGIGIEAQYQDQVFGLFNKLDPQTEGTGVGLALVRRIIETHGGEIWIESAGKDSGTTFCFTLPVQKPDAQGAAPV